MTDNMVGSGDEKVILEWRKRNKVFDEITDEEFDGILNRETIKTVKNLSDSTGRTSGRL